MQITSLGEAELLRGSSGQAAVHLGRRRFAFFALVSATMLALIAALAIFFMQDGLNLAEAAMIVLFALNLPWIAIGAWNAVIGFILLRLTREGLRRVVPLAGIARHPQPPSGRIAIVMPVCDEDPTSVFRTLRATIASLDATGRDEPFDVFVLSDTRDGALAALEHALFCDWAGADRRPARLHYRRRLDNAGFKAGNIRAFCERWGGEYEHMIVLDADSVMSGAAILRMVGLMESNPALGILQTLITGLPSISPFARIVQFGMRHGMRSYTTGGAWWQGDAGPYWGHNAIIRLAPFIEHCRLPRVPGHPPLGGEVLSHDLLEAVLMRRAGWEVRVLPIEDGSFEANPPSLLDFIKRDLRWCQGNLQYTRLLHMAGAHRLGRLQMLLAILMYTSAPCWMGFWLLGLLQLLASAAGLQTGVLLGEPAWLGWALFACVLAMIWTPKLCGLLDVLTRRFERRRYGGAGPLMRGAAIEFLFSSLLAPIISTAQTIFIGGLFVGRRPEWASQVRAERRVTAGQAAGRLWPQTLLGAAVLVSMLLATPAAVWWVSPMITGLLLAIPFAMLTSSARAGRLLVAASLCATPEELHAPAEVRAACPWLAESGSPRHSDVAVAAAAKPAANATVEARAAS